MNPYERMRDPFENKKPFFSSATGRGDDNAQQERIFWGIQVAVSRCRDPMRLLSLTRGEDGSPGGRGQLYLCPWARPRMWEHASFLSLSNGWFRRDFRMRACIARLAWSSSLLLFAALSCFPVGAAKAADILPWRGTVTTTVRAQGDGWTWNLDIGWRAPVRLTEATARAPLVWKERTVSPLGCVHDTHQIGAATTPATIAFTPPAADGSWGFDTTIGSFPTHITFTDSGPKGCAYGTIGPLPLYAGKSGCTHVTFPAGSDDPATDTLVGSGDVNLDAPGPIQVSCAVTGPSTVSWNLSRLPDRDSDGILDTADNCPDDPNPDQANFEGDAQGVVCEADDDNDGLTDVQEAAIGSNPHDPDSDDDGLLDGREVGLGTNPLAADTDGGGINDGNEVNANRTDPLGSTDDFFAQCSVGRDNDGDGRVDLADPGCASPEDTDEVDPCDGLTTNEVRGTSKPNYLGVPIHELSRFPNSAAACEAIWAPDLNAHFVPQGLALRGDGSALVSGYIATSNKDNEFCHLVQVDLATGTSLAARDFKRTQCKHGGGIVIDDVGRIWIADTPGLLLLNSGVNDQTPQKVNLVGQDGSFLAGGAVGRLEVGDRKKHVIYAYTYTVLAAAAAASHAGFIAEVNVSQAVFKRVVAATPQGADFHLGEFWVASSTATCGKITGGDGFPAGGVGFGPGVEEIEFAPDGSLWAVFEAGTIKHTFVANGTFKPNRRFYPLIVRFDPAKLTKKETCPTF